ncbi:MAG: LysE family transporter [Chloroflexi bacterium]|nr:LysE family transporter [Chloroflexota bacterium]
MESALSLAIRGVVVGFTIAAAVGPISVLTIRRTIAHGQLYGLVSGLGVASADASYAGIAAFGLTAVSGLLVSGRVLLGLVGGAIIVLLGIRTIRSRPGEAATTAERPGLGPAFASIYALTMTNPMTILSFAAVFAGLGFAAGATTAGDAAALTIGVWAGSGLWWVVLTSLVGWLRGRVSYRGLVWINRASGTALVAFGLVAIALASGAVG